MFENFVNVETINFNENFDTSNVVSTERIFCNYQSLITINLSSFDTSNLVIMSGMFQMFNISTLTDTNSQFKEIVFGDNFKTNNVVSMSSLFYHCNKLTEIDLSSFNTANVTNMSGMFFARHSLNALDLSNFDTAKVTHMKAMFWYTTSLTELNLCSFNTLLVADMAQMFRDDNNLQKYILDLTGLPLKQIPRICF